MFRCHGLAQAAGYCPGANVIAATLLLFMREQDACGPKIMIIRPKLNMFSIDIITCHAYYFMCMMPHEIVCGIMHMSWKCRPNIPSTCASRVLWAYE